MRDEHARSLRNAFGVYTTGVTVATCVRGNGTPVGVTANSFVSLSLSPPLVSIALHTSARHLRDFLESGVFAINVLGVEQHALSNLFARPSECSWEGVRFQVTSSGHIVLEGVAASFLCRLTAQHPVGDHLLLVGRVEHFTCNTQIDPLAFLRGRYGRFQPVTQAAPAEFLDHWSTPALGWS